MMQQPLSFYAPPLPRETVDFALEKVCRMHGVALAYVKLNRTRTLHVVQARWACFAYLKNELAWSSMKIARYFERDHTTVLHGLRQWEAMATVKEEPLPQLRGMEL